MIYEIPKTFLFFNFQQTKDELKEKWKNLTEEERQKYLDNYKMKNQEYFKEMEKWENK